MDTITRFYRYIRKLITAKTITVMTTSPSTKKLEQKALLLESKQGKFVLGSKNIPSPGERQLLVKIKATALNPVDWIIQKHGLFIDHYPAVLGNDLAGDVVEVGQGVTVFKPGDKVFCQGQYNDQYATFQEYALADEFHLAKIPDNITYDEAATIPVTLTCAYIGLFHVPPYGAGAAEPTIVQGANSGTPLVVLGGGTSVGQYVIQLAKIAGFSPIITTASLKHSDHLISLGATAVLDRNLPISSLREEIEKITTKPIMFVYSTVLDTETQQIGIDILAPGGHLVLVGNSTIDKPTDKNIVQVFGVRQVPRNVNLLIGAYGKLTEWLKNGMIKPNRLEVIPGGLTGIVNGLLRLEQNQVSGVKLVVRPEETVLSGQE